MGIPDSNIVLMLADDFACDARNVFASKIFADESHATDLYGADVEIDYRGYEVTPENVLRVLYGEHPPSTPESKRLRSDAGSNVLFYLTGHGGDEFLKFQDQREILSRDVADARGLEPHPGGLLIPPQRVGKHELDVSNEPFLARA